MKYNAENNITPQTIIKPVHDVLEISTKTNVDNKSGRKLSRKEKLQLIDELTKEMKAAAKILEFEHAAYLRDKIEKLKQEI